MQTVIIGLGAIGRISGQGHYARLTDTFQMKQPG